MVGTAGERLSEYHPEQDRLTRSNVLMPMYATEFPFRMSMVSFLTRSCANSVDLTGGFVLNNPLIHAAMVRASALVSRPMGLSRIAFSSAMLALLPWSSSAGLLLDENGRRYDER